MSEPPLLCIMGPTAAGKTDLAIALAEHLGGELINVDSALVYRGLNIGAAKPDYPHHLIDIRDPSEPYSAADFARDAKGAIRDIVARGKQPILVGGTMLYYRALLRGFDAMPPSDPVIRAAIVADGEQLGWEVVHEQLQAIDPIAADQIHPHHSQRLARALEVYRISGKPMSSFQTGQAQSEFRSLSIAVCPAKRADLHDRIAQRLEGMFARGLVSEVAGLRDRGDLSPDLPAMRAVGYRQVWAHLSGEFDLATSYERTLAATRQLAKRQITWLRSWPDLHWLLTDAQGVAETFMTPHEQHWDLGAHDDQTSQRGAIEILGDLWRNFLAYQGS